MCIVRTALGVIACQQRRGLTELAIEAQVPLVDGEQRLKATLNCNGHKFAPSAA